MSPSWTNILKTIQQEKARISFEGTGKVEKDMDKPKEPVDESPMGLLAVHPSKSYKAECVKLDWDVSSSIFKTNASSQKNSDIVRIPEPTFITSHRFTVVTSDGKSTEWTILMNPCYIENGIRYISLYLWFCKAPKDKFVDMSYKLLLLSKNGTELHSKAALMIRRLTESNNTLGWIKFIPLKKIGVDPPQLIHFQALLTVYTEVDKPPDTLTAKSDVLNWTLEKFNSAFEVMLKNEENKGEKYSMQDFVTDFFKLGNVLTDLNKDPELYASLLF